MRAPIPDPALFPAPVDVLLRQAGAPGHRPPLRSQTPADAALCLSLARQPAQTLFPAARHAEAALAGLLLYAGCFEQSHQVAQSVEAPEGSYWHGILHRQEPDAFNANYWFRRVGRHAIFPALYQQAQAILLHHPDAPFRLSKELDASQMVELCTTAQPGSPEEALALDLQDAEWQLLFAYCAQAG